MMQDFLRAVETQGIPVTDDLQDLTTAHGAEHWLVLSSPSDNSQLIVYIQVEVDQPRHWTP
jgi:hypothetical protein